MSSSSSGPGPARLTVSLLTGVSIAGRLDDIARLRITVFREYPYLYDGDARYEADYLKTYAACPDSIVITVSDGTRIVGASTGLPLDSADEEFRAPFAAQGIDPASVFYFGESVLLPAYRGMGLGVRFIEERENHARRLGRFRLTGFCAVLRPDDHPLRPPDYVPLDRFWSKRGYRKQAGMTATYRWKEIGEAYETPKRLVFWLKDLEP